MAYTRRQLLAIAAELSRAYEKGEADLTQVLLRGTGTSWRQAFNRQQREQVRRILHELERETRRWSVGRIPAMYLQGRSIVTPGILAGGMKLEFAQLHEGAVHAITENLALKLGEARFTVGRQAEDIFRKAGMEAAREGFVQGKTARQVRKQIVRDLTAEGIEGFTDKAGRKWTLSSYAAMVSRTTTIQATDAGMFGQMEEEGYDLMRVGAHVGTCPMCAPWEGRVLSLSGKTRGYPTLANAKAAGFRHPNCRHVLATVSTGYGAEIEKRAGFEPAVTAAAQREWLKGVDGKGHPAGGLPAAFAQMHSATDDERKALKLPPAWKQVVVSDDPNAGLQAVGIDKKGRRQYRYSAAHSEAQAAEKFSRLKDFTPELRRLRPRIERDAVAGSEEAAALRLIDRTGFRVGSERETLAEVKAYGATTLEARHVTIVGNNVVFDFIGKKGVRITKTVEDKVLARDIERRAAGGGKLFQTSDGAVRDYLHRIDGEFKVKDFRTWNGTAKALEKIHEIPTPTTAAEYKQDRQSVAETVAEHLGNTPMVALKSYIDPAVFGPWEAAIR